MVTLKSIHDPPDNSSVFLPLVLYRALDIARGERGSGSHERPPSFSSPIGIIILEVPANDLREKVRTTVHRLSTLRRCWGTSSLPHPSLRTRLYTGAPLFFSTSGHIGITQATLNPSELQGGCCQVSISFSASVQSSCDMI